MAISAIGFLEPTTRHISGPLRDLLAVTLKKKYDVIEQDVTVIDLQFSIFRNAFDEDIYI